MRQTKKKHIDLAFLENNRDRSTLNKNLMLFKLLTYVPEFQKDLEKIRQEMSIKPDVFKWPTLSIDDERDEAYENENELTEWANKNDYPYYQFQFDKEFPLSPLGKEIYKIGIKYKLPFNFYNVPADGLTRYVLTNEILLPYQNYKIDFGIDDSNLLYTSLIVYTKLNNKEAKDAILELNDTQKYILPIFYKNLDTVVKKRFHRKMSRDILLLEEQMSRSEKPKKIVTYLKGNYMDYLNKSNDFSKKEKIKVSRLHKKTRIIKYSELTSKNIGKKRGVSADVTRQSKKRLDSLAKDFFGYGLLP
jgi:hypothetical protein